MVGITELMKWFLSEREKDPQEEPGDYRVNGILHCGKCRTPKQATVNFGGQTYHPYAKCRCESEAWQAEKDRPLINDMRRQCFSTDEYFDWTFENDEGKCPRLLGIGKRYVAEFERFLDNQKGLLFYGTTGTGKSYTAACICNALLDKKYPCKFMQIPDAEDEIAKAYANRGEIIGKINSYALVVIDELGVERNSEYMRELVYRIINKRYASQLPTIITTNLSKEKLWKTTDADEERVYSRLFEMCIPIECNGPDIRKEKLRENYQKYRDLLGY